MPRLRARVRGKHKKLDVRRREKGRKRKGRSSAQHSVEELLQKVDECVDSFQYEVAVSLCERALEMDPQGVAVLETAGPLFLEVGLTDKALECFKSAVDLSPDEGYSKYMYLAQMSGGEEAVKYFTKGIQIMTKVQQGQLEGACAGVPDAVTGEDISNAYCAMAEIYLTDLCMFFVSLTADAEQHCHDCCMKAVEYSPGNTEAYQLMTSCLLSQDKREEAKTVLLKGISLWLPSNSEAPPYSSRISYAKLLLELEEYETSFDILEGLLKEDDEVVQVWYLMGWLHHLKKDKDSARFYLQQTEQLFHKLECDDTGLLDHTKQLLEELGPETPACSEEEGVAAGCKEISDSDDDDDGDMDVT